MKAALFNKNSVPPRPRWIRPRPSTAAQCSRRSRTWLNSLDGLARDSQALTAARNAKSAGRRSLAFARASRQAGKSGVLQELAAEQTYAQAQAALAAADAARYADTAALFQALGGGA